MDCHHPPEKQRPQLDDDDDNVDISLADAAVSINDLLRRHCRECPLVPPLQWTNRHLHFLECSFATAPSPPADQPRTSPISVASPDRGSSHRPEMISPPISPLSTTSLDDSSSEVDAGGNEQLLRNAQIVACGRGAVHRQISMSMLLGHGGPLQPDFQRPSLNFYYNNGHFCTPIPCLLFGRLRQSSPRHQSSKLPLFPMAVWLDRGPHINKLRKAIFPEPRRHGRNNLPVAALYQTRLRRITPAEPLCDPYIVAVLLALAQAEREWEDTYTTTLDPERSKAFTARLILGDTEDKETMQLYVADVPTSLLDKLAQPSLKTSMYVGGDGVASSSSSSRLQVRMFVSLPRTGKSDKGRREREDEDRKQGGVKRRRLSHDDDDDDDDNDFKRRKKSGC
ncbi:hypothetical protein F5X99DRAFT_406086 [Biscogniauxia marginata]|nr:hypothetical protein F5X99DRAFT_406086 [Biscogniauxia marginata]